MAIKVKTQDGRTASFDLTKWFQDNQSMPVAASGNIITTRTADGRNGVVNLNDLFDAHGLTVDRIENGLNSPETALQSSPIDTNALDVATWEMGGSDLAHLMGHYRDAKRLDDGRVVVLDKDNLWRTFRDPSDPLIIPKKPSYAEQVLAGQMPDMDIVLRQAGVALILGMAGIVPDDDAPKGVPPLLEDLEEAFEVIHNNLSAEGKMMLGLLVEQLTGMPKWQFMFLCTHCPSVFSVEYQCWDDQAIVAKSKQMAMAQQFVEALYSEVFNKFMISMKAVQEMDGSKANKFKMDLKALTDPFIQAMNSMGIIEELKIISGWKDQEENIRSGHAKPDDYPPNIAMMSLYNVVKATMTSSLADKTILTGEQGFKAAVSVDVFVERALMSLADLPNCAVKTKTFLLLRDFQARLETAMAGPFDDDKKPNAFALARQTFGPQRESLYSFIQVPKTLWAKTLLDGVSQDDDPEQTLSQFAGPTKMYAEGLIATEVAYNMRPWFDKDYLGKINAGIQYTDLGDTPPHNGFLSKHSPRVAQNIANMVDVVATQMLKLDPESRKMFLRNPAYLQNIISAMSQGVQMQEGLTQQARNSLGLGSVPDQDAPPDIQRIFEDPEKVQADVEAQRQQQMQQQIAQQQMEQQQKEQQVLQMKVQAQAQAENGKGKKKAAQNPPAAPQGAAPSTPPPPTAGPGPGVSAGGPPISPMRGGR